MTKLNPNPAPGARTPDLAAIVAGALREAQAAQPVILRAPADPQADFQVLRNPTPAAALRTLPVTLQDAAATTDPAAATFGADIARASRLAGIGLQVITIPAQSDAQGQAVGGDGQPVVLTGTALAEFSVIDPAVFAETDEDQNFTLLTNLADVTPILASGLRQHGFRVTINRATLKDRPTDTIAREVAEAITSGLGRLIDRVALSALTTGTSQPAIGTWRTAVSDGVAFEDLRAVVGTGALAVEPQAVEGRMYHAGVPAVGTDQSAGSWVGDWRTHCFAMAGEVGLLVHKINAQGELRISCWAGAVGISPTPRTRLWRLAGA